MSTWNGKGTRSSLGPRVKAGDVVTVEIDALKKEIRFYRNQVRRFIESGFFVLLLATRLDCM